MSATATAATTVPRTLRLGDLEVATPVVLAPMAGVTNAPFRRLCSEQGAGLYVCEMITSRGIVEGDRTSLAMLKFDETEKVRSVQLYGVDPVYIGKAVAILHAAVAAARPYGVPVTMKTRMGIDDEHLTYLDAGRIAQEAGCAAIALHARTASQHYSGTADWDAIAMLKQAVDIPVLGNGDIWEAADALRMVEHTGCDGVVVGRGCLGRPWLFRDLAAAFGGEHVTALPSLGEVMAMMRRHAELLAQHMGEERGSVEFRKHIAWYLKGFRAGGSLRNQLSLISSLGALDDLLAGLDPAEPYPVAELGTPRGRQGSPKRVTVPDGWLDTREMSGAMDAAAEDGTSGG